MRRTNTYSLGAAVALMLGATSASAVIVDLFEDPPGNQEVEATGAAPTTDFNQAGSFTTILGGYRDLIVTKNDGPDNGTARLVVADNTLTFDTDSLVDGTGIIQWDGDDSGSIETLATNLLDLDLINQDGCGNQGCDRMIFDVLFADTGFDFEITLYDTDGDSSTILGTSPGVAVADQFTVPFEVWNQADGTSSPGDGSTPPINVDFAYSIARQGGLVDFTSIAAMELVLNTNGSLALDVTIDDITKEGRDDPAGNPTPATLALIASGLFGIGAARARRGRNQTQG
jgi:hypothetical protein